MALFDPLWSLIGADAGVEAARQNRAYANQLAGQTQFTPYNVYSGMGSATFGPGGGISTTLAPQYQGMVDMARGLSTGELTGLTGAQQGLMGQYANLANASSMAAVPGLAANQYGLMQQMVAPQREQQQTSLENRLFAQGMLGSTGGAQRVQAQQAGFNQQDLGMQQAALGQALQAQGQMFGQQMGALGQFGNLAEQQRMLMSPERRLGLLSGAGSFAQGMESMPLQLAQMGLGAGSQQAQLDMAKMGMLMQAQQGVGAAQSQLGMMPLQLAGQLGMGYLMGGM